MFIRFLNKIFGSRNDRLLKDYRDILYKVNSYESSFKKISDSQLKGKTVLFKNRLLKHDTLDNILPEAFATVREVSYRVLGLRHYDVQILGGIALHYGKIAEIATGEGKTLVATLPVYLNSLIGESVHIVTVNDYLAKRDSEWMNPIYNFLNLSVGLIVHGMSVCEKKRNYNSDIVYGTNNELGFDYLRDNLVNFIEDKVQKDLSYVIVDEVDSILIDEARVPLIISYSGSSDTSIYKKIARIASQLKVFDSKINDGDYVLDEESKQVYLTDAGFSKLEKLLVEYGFLNWSVNLYESSNIGLLHDVYAAIKANIFFKINVDYIVKNNEVIIIDEHTGRTMEGRRWSDGIHQALEVKESVSIQSENQTLASITFQNYFRLYKKLSGMTGTAYTEAYEFQEIYNTEVIIIPSNKNNIRIDYSDCVYLTKNMKFKFIINDIINCYNKKQPVLVGTVSIEVSEYISKKLSLLKVKHNVLNAKYHSKESQIISEAGSIGSITIATNMAGRGTDIVLGGNKENHDDKSLKDYNFVVKSGGLKVIGTERHESRRIDNQLRGRSARQGDPGNTQFYLSLEDDLVRIFVSDKIASVLNKLSLKENEVIKHSLVNKAIENAQRKVEGHNFDIRKQLLEYDNIINEQRVVIYDRRNFLLINKNISCVVNSVFHDVLDKLFSNYIKDKIFDLKKFLKLLKLEFGFKLCLDKFKYYDNLDYLKSVIINRCLFLYAIKRYKVGVNNIRLFENILFLNILDVKWKEHLVTLEQVRKSIHLRGYAQKDPKHEYKREAFILFTNMLDNIKYEFLLLLLKFPLDMINSYKEKYIKPVSSKSEFIYSNSDSKSDENHKNKKTTYVRKHNKIGRNAMCYCGSNIKYKQCHGKKSGG